MAQSNDFKPREKSDFSRQKLKKLPKEVLCLSTDVLSLNLKNNRLKSVSGISALCYLKELNLSANDLSEFPQEIEELSNLEILYLSQNNITKIPEGVFSQLEKLQFLKLSTNCLKELPLDLGQCKSLRYLNLSNNHLEDVKVLEALCGLKELYVKNNKLTELPSRLFLNTDLTKFKADGNPLRKPPEEVCAGGVKSIKHYFSSLGISEQCVRRVKTMFLGSSMAGKSTICYSLRKGLPVEVDVADRTVGIEISEVQLGDVHFLFWDFAGHEEYYFTHHVFITPQAFVILTVNLASYDIKNPQSFKDCVSFWIKNVQLRVPNAVVLVVGTHSDECRGVEDVQEKKEDIDKKIRDMLKERKANLERKSNLEEDQNKTAQFSDQLRKFQHCAEHNIKVLDLVAMDCTKPEEIEKIQNCILCQVNDKTLFPNIEKILPQLYQEVESSIKELKEDTDFSGHGVMSFEEILNELKGKLEKLDQEDLQPILRYLHQIGIIVWYEEIADLKETVFVEPSFLIKLFKTVVRHDLVDQLQGISRDELMEESSLSVQRDKWINDLKGKATLHSAAIRVLLRKSLRKELEIDDKDFFDVVVGTRSSDGMVLGLLQQFEICLPAQLTSPLNPKARDFVPNERWEPLDTSMYNRDAACLFPSHLKDNSVVLKMWGEDRNDDIQVQVYFLPEMPHGFFQRLIIKICSFYPVHWVGKDHCLVCAGNRLVLFKEKCLRGDQLIEIRCKRQHHSAHVNTAVDMRCPSWDMILVVLRRLIELAQQWPGLCLYVCSPCTEDGCSDHFAWPDWKELNGHNLYNIQKDDKMVCCNGHTHRTELLFPKVPKARSKSDND